MQPNKPTNKSTNKLTNKSAKSNQAEKLQQENKGTKSAKKTKFNPIKIIVIVAATLTVVAAAAIIVRNFVAPKFDHEDDHAPVVIDGRTYYPKDKPIIYLYPTKDENVTVKLGHSDRLTVSYPKYTDGWKVRAHTNGTLTDLSTGRQLYSLYYESKSLVNPKVKKDGFVVKGEDSAKFLEDKLDQLGLSEREAEEFIVYWLPKLEANKYNYIRFADMDEINADTPLEIMPKPDTTIRVLMVFKPLDKPIKVSEQKLVTPKRDGFVAVEWGGTEIK